MKPTAGMRTPAEPGMLSTMMAAMVEGPAVFLGTVGITIGKWWFNGGLMGFNGI